MHRVEIFIITKDEGANLTKFDILGEYNSEKDELVSGFLAALNNFAKEIGFPAGVSLIRSGSLEARYAMGKYIYTVMIIDYQMSLGMTTDSTLDNFSNDVTELFERIYEPDLLEGKKKKLYRSSTFAGFNKEIQKLIEKYMDEVFILYQKLILIESMYIKIPQKYCLPLLEKASCGENIIPLLTELPSGYHTQLRRAIDKVNSSAAPLWEIFQVPTTDYQPFD